METLHSSAQQTAKPKSSMAHRILALTGLLCLASVRAFHYPGVIAHSSVVGGITTSNRLIPSVRPSPWLGTRSQQQRVVDKRIWSLGAEPTDSEEGAADDEVIPGQSTALVPVSSPKEPPPKGLKRVKLSVARFFGAGKEKPNLKQLGLYAALSYGFVSNASYSVCTGVSWFISSKKSGLSPLTPGQWPTFLAVYAGMFAVNNVLRVPRLALAVSLAPAFDRFIAFLMRRTGRGKAFATGMCVFLVNVLGTLTLMSSGIVLASILSGVPFWPVPAT